MLALHLATFANLLRRPLIYNVVSPVKALDTLMPKLSVLLKCSTCRNWVDIRHYRYILGLSGNPMDSLTH